MKDKLMEQPSQKHRPSFQAAILRVVAMQQALVLATDTGGPEGTDHWRLKPRW